MSLPELLLSKPLITVSLFRLLCPISLRFTDTFIGAFFPGQNQDGTKIISGGADNAARLFDIQSGQSSQVAQHDNAIKVVKWIETPQGGILATGSWDKTLKVRPLHLFVSLRIHYKPNTDRWMVACSTGTYEPQTQSPSFNFQSDVTPWTCSIPCWSWAPQSAILPLSTLPKILPPHRKCVVIF